MIPVASAVVQSLGRLDIFTYFVNAALSFLGWVRDAPSAFHVASHALCQFSKRRLYSVSLTSWYPRPVAALLAAPDFTLEQRGLSQHNTTSASLPQSRQWYPSNFRWRRNPLESMRGSSSKALSYGCQCSQKRQVSADKSALTTACIHCLMWKLRSNAHSEMCGPL